MILSEVFHNGKSEIKNIIFDWGGVLTNLHFEATKNAFRDLGLTVLDGSDTHLPHDDLFISFEIGKISPVEFRNRLRKYAVSPLTDSQIDKAWCAMLGELPPERWKILEMTQKQYRTFLLSNTNAIHIPYYFNLLQGIYGTNGYTHLFEKTYYSHILGLRKPNPDIFEYVLRDTGISPLETLFIDDYLENIETARQLGFQTVHLKSPLTLTDVFTG